MVPFPRASQHFELIYELGVMINATQSIVHPSNSLLSRGFYLISSIFAVEAIKNWLLVPGTGPSPGIGLGSISGSFNNFIQFLWKKLEMDAWIKKRIIRNKSLFDSSVKNCLGGAVCVHFQLTS